MSAIKVGSKVVNAKGDVYMADAYVTHIHTGDLAGMCTVRIWSGSRHVGDTCMSIHELRLA